MHPCAIAIASLHPRGPRILLPQRVAASRTQSFLITNSSDFRKLFYASIWPQAQLALGLGCKDLALNLISLISSKPQ